MGTENSIWPSRQTVTYPGSLNFSILTGKGKAARSARPSITLRPALLPASVSTSLAVEDFNGDGHADLAVGGIGTQSGSLSVLAGNGDGTFRVLSSAPLGLNETLSLATADLNGDGRVDVVTASGLSRNVSVSLGAAPSALMVVSIIVAGSDRRDTLYLFTLSASGGTFPYHWTVAAGTLPPRPDSEVQPEC